MSLPLADVDNVDLAPPHPKLVIHPTAVCGPCLAAEVAQKSPHQGGEPLVVQPVSVQPTLRTDVAVRVVVHLLKTK
jgi:hypothetical protein